MTQYPSLMSPDLVGCCERRVQACRPRLLDDGVVFSVLFEVTVNDPAYDTRHVAIHPIGESAHRPGNDVVFSARDALKHHIGDCFRRHHLDLTRDGFGLGRLDFVLLVELGRIRVRGKQDRYLDVVVDQLLPQAVAETRDSVLAGGVGRISVDPHEPEN